MKKVLFVTDKLITGGAERYFMKIENRLSRENIELYCGAGPGDFEKEVKHKESFIPLFKSSWYKNLTILHRIVQEKEIQVFHANSLRMLFYGILFKMRNKKLRLIYTKHNVTLLEKKSPKLFTALLNAFFVEIITVSQDENKKLAALGVRKHKIETIYNGVDLQRFSYTLRINQGATKHIGILARLSPEKNHKLFLEIAKELQNKSYLFHIAGEGEEKENLEALVKKMGLRKKVVFHGNVKDPENFIKKMDVLLLTSTREVFPMTVIEAMAVGTPMVAVEVGGIGEAIENHITGELVQSHDAKKLAAAVEELLKHPAYRKQIIENAYHKVQQMFSEQNMLEKTLELYNRGGY